MAPIRSRLGATQEIDIPLLVERPPSGPTTTWPATFEPDPQATAPAFEIYLLQGLYEDMLKHVWGGYLENKQTPIEVTGIIAGHPFLDPGTGTPYIVGVEQIELNTPSQSLVHVHVDPEEIGRARQELESQGLAAVIWYHSHPGHGIFLSGDDQVITQHIFNAEWHVAIVFDSITNKWGMFRGPEREIIPSFKLIKEEPEEIKFVRLYNLALNSIKQRNYEWAGKYFLKISRQFSDNPAALPYWEHRGGYRDVDAHLQCVKTYGEAMQALEAGDREGATSQFHWIIDVQPQGYLDVQDRLTALAEDIPTRRDEPPGPPDAPQQPGRPRGYPHQPSGGPAPRSQTHSPQQGRPRPANRRTTWIILGLVAVGIVALIGLALVGVYVGAIQIPGVPSLGVGSPFTPSADAPTPTPPVVIAETSAPTLPPTDLPTLTPVLPIQSFRYTGVVAPSPDPANPPINANLLVIVLDEQQRPLPGIDVVVETIGYRNTDDPREGTPGPRLTDALGEYLQTNWGRQKDVTVSLGGMYQNVSLQGTPVHVELIPGKKMVVTFTLLAVY